jgi:hypothetical protein
VIDFKSYTLIERRRLGLQDKNLERCEADGSRPLRSCPPDRSNYLRVKSLYGSISVRPMAMDSNQSVLHRRRGGVEAPPA